MTKNFYRLHRLMCMANALKRHTPIMLRGRQTTNSQALKYAWWFEHFRDQLRTGVWRFSYIKLDGSIREARGTLCFDFIPEDKRPNKSQLVADAVISNIYAKFTYYDIDCQDWRSFRLYLFIGFVEPVSDLKEKKK